MGAIGIGAFVTAALATGGPSPDDGLQLLGLALLYCGGALLEVPVGKASLNLGYMVLFAVMVNLGPVHAMWLVLAAAVVLALRRKRSIRDSAFNFGQQSLCVLLGLVVFVLLGGQVGAVSLSRAAIPLVAGSLVFDVANAALVAAGFALRGDGTFVLEFAGVYWQQRRFTAMLYHALALTSAVLYAHEGFAAAVLLAVLILSMRSAFVLSHQVEQHRQAALRDGMTEVYNYRFLAEWVRGRGSELVARGIPFCFLFVDIDGLKAINDSLGHVTGDAVIRCVATSLSRVCRKDDPIIRYGGDEFLAILIGTESRGGFRVARRLLQVLTDDVKTDIPFTVSVGVASYPADAESTDELFEVVDGASYRGKERRCHTVYTVKGHSWYA